RGESLWGPPPRGPRGGSRACPSAGHRVARIGGDWSCLPGPPGRSWRSMPWPPGSTRSPAGVRGGSGGGHDGGRPHGCGPCWPAAVSYFPRFCRALCLSDCRNDVQDVQELLGELQHVLRVRLGDGVTPVVCPVSM